MDFLWRLFHFEQVMWINKRLLVHNRNSYGFNKCATHSQRWDKEMIEET